MWSLSTANVLWPDVYTDRMPQSTHRYDLSIIYVDKVDDFPYLSKMNYKVEWNFSSILKRGHSINIHLQKEWRLKT